MIGSKFCQSFVDMPQQFLNDLAVFLGSDCQFAPAEA